MKHFDPNITSRDLNRLMALVRDPNLIARVKPLLSSDPARAVADAIVSGDTNCSDANDIKSFITEG